MKLNNKKKEDKLIYWCNKLPKLINKPSFKKIKELEKKKNKKRKLLLIKKKEIEKNTRPNSKLKESRMKKKEKSKDSENFKKKLLIDKPK